MKTPCLIAAALSLLLVIPACSELQSDKALRAEPYTSSFDFEYAVTSFKTKYLVPVVHNSISKEDVMGKVKGQGWKTAAVYQLNLDKEVVKQFVLVTGNSISTMNNETFPSYLIISADGQSVTSYDLHSCCYETHRFIYDETNNAITLPITFGSWGGNGRLVSLTSDTMVCVCTRDKNYKGEELIFMEILQRVSASERQSWIDNCPHRMVWE